MKEKVYEILKKVCLRAYEYDGEDMIEEEIIESMEIMNIVVALEEELSIEIPPTLILPEYFETRDTIVELAVKASGR